MVSNFEADDNEGDEESLDVVAEVFTKSEETNSKFQSVSTRWCQGGSVSADRKIDDSLNKLFQCMSKVYAHKLSSPKWNRFLGLKLRWKDKIRLNNLIWRCWHMQFIGRKKKLMFDFVNPMEAENPTQAVEGGGTLMMGKYWKRRMDSVLAEYKKWRIYYKSHNSSNQSSQLGGFCKHSKVTNQVVDDIDLVNMISDADIFINSIMADLESSPLGLDDDWNIFSNSDFIQTGLINLKAQTNDDLCLHGHGASSSSVNDCMTTEVSVPVTSVNMPNQYDQLNIQSEIMSPHLNDQISMLPLVEPMLDQRESMLPQTDADSMLPKIEPIQPHTELKLPQSSVMQVIDNSSSFSNDFTSFHPNQRDIISAGNNNTKSELANILKGGQYILEKRKDQEMRSIQKSVIVQAPTQPFKDSIIDNDNAAIAITSRFPRKKRQSLKRKHDVTPEKEENLSKMVCPTNASFQKLSKILPGLSDSSVKVSKAAQLMKAADEIKTLKLDNDNLSQEIELLKATSAELLDSITSCQNDLSCSRAVAFPNSENNNSLEGLFDDHVKTCSLQNWKYWIFSQALRPILQTYEKNVSNSSYDDFCRTSSSWLDQNVNLVQLRPIVTDMLKKISVETSILTDPKRLPLEALEKSSKKQFL